MKWKQFFTPVSSIDGAKAREIVQAAEHGEVLYLDVRQPKEYEQGHLPGAKLIPVGDLDKRLDELDKDQPTVIYWAIGGRSRVAAQMLAGKGFTKIYNLSGGIKAWEKETAYGPEDQGMTLFSGNEGVEDCIVVAYGLEEGLREFYLTMQERTRDEEAQALFAKLAEIEVLHQQRLVEIYNEVTGKSTDMEEFSASIVTPGMEGGMTTEEYLARFHPDLESLTDILSLAMSIEAQALDLYQRAAFTTEDVAAEKVLEQIACEERVHLQYLADYMDKHLDE